MARIVKRSIAPEQSFMEDFVQADLNVGNVPKSILPPVNIREDDHLFSMEVAAPGYEPEELKARIDKDILTISAQRKSTKKEKTNLLRNEFQYTSFHRTFRLPQDVSAASLITAYKRGILLITIKKL